MSEKVKLICTYRKEQGLPADLNTYANRGQLVRRCANYQPAQGKRGLSPSCLWCNRSEIEIEG